MKLLKKTRYGWFRFYPLDKEGVNLLKAFSQGERERKCLTEGQVKALNEAGMPVEIREEIDATRVR